MEDCKTTIISYNKTGTPKEEPEFENSRTAAIQRILYNQTDEAIIKPEVSLPTARIQLNKEARKLNRKSIEEVNPHVMVMPKFYKKELHRHYLLVWLWVALTALCLAFEGWALFAIIQNPTVSNWAGLTLIPMFALCVAFLVLYANKYVNYRNEARAVNFEGKPVTVCVRKLYIRLKSAHINVNWFCSLFYIIGLYAIAICFMTAGILTGKWGDISTANLERFGGPAILITVICAIITIFASFFMHIFLLVTNHSRSGKIDSYYGVQIVSDDELREIKKMKNKRDLIIFFACVMVFVLLGLLIYRIVKSRKVQNNVTITNR